MQIRFLTSFAIFLFLLSLLLNIFLVILIIGKAELDPVHLSHGLLPALRPQLHLLVSQEAFVQLGLDELVSEGLVNEKRVSRLSIDQCMRREAVIRVKISLMMTRFKF